MAADDKDKELDRLSLDDDEQTGPTSPGAQQTKESKDREAKEEKNESEQEGIRSVPLNKKNRIRLIEELFKQNPDTSIIRECLAGVTELDLSKHYVLSDFTSQQIITLAKFLPECSGLKIINLSGHNIRLEGLQALAEVLPRCRTLQALNISNAEIMYDATQRRSDEGLKALAAALPGCPVLDMLDISDNVIRSEGLQVLAKVLPQCQKLQTLCINHNNIMYDATKNRTKEGLGALAVTLPKCLALGTLEIRGNYIGESMPILAAALPLCCKLHTLDVGFNYLFGNYHLSFEGSIHAFSEMLAKCRALTSLNVESNNILKEGLEILVNELAKYPTLCALYIGSNEIGGEGISILAAGLSKFPALHTLDISNTGFGIRTFAITSRTKDIGALVNMVDKCHALQTLNISGNDIRDEGMQILAPALLRCPTLHTLYINNTKMGDKGVLALIPALLKNHWLHLEINNNDFGSKAVYGLAQALPESTLVTLSMVSNDMLMDFKAARAIVMGLRFNTSLVRLTMYESHKFREVLEKEDMYFLLDRNRGFQRLELESQLADDIFFPALAVVVGKDLNKIIAAEYAESEINTGNYLIRPVIAEFLAGATGIENWLAAEKFNQYYTVFNTHDGAQKAAADVSTRLQKCGLDSKVNVKIVAESPTRFTLNIAITRGQLYTWAMATPNLPQQSWIPKVEEKKREVKKNSNPKIPDQQPPVFAPEKKKRISIGSQSENISQQGLFSSSSSSSSIAAPASSSGSSSSSLSFAMHASLTDNGPLSSFPTLPITASLSGRADKKKEESKQESLGDSAEDQVRPPDPIVEEQLLGNAHQEQLAHFTSLDLLNNATAFALRREIVMNAKKLGIKPDELNTLRLTQDRDKIGNWLVSCLTLHQVQALKIRFLDELEQNIGERRPGDIKNFKKEAIKEGNKNKECVKYLLAREEELMKISAPSNPIEIKRSGPG